ncbi:MAG: ribosome recycling factor [Elusimicrobia bacterium]|nr:ribosome recycling factor [Elusimicrobiota bacterium]
MSNQILLQAEEKMKKTAEHLKSEFLSLKTGRATPAILDTVKVKYYDTDVPVNQVAGITIPEPRLIVITPWEKSLLPELEKAILKADIGITPQNDGKVIRLPVPQLTEERRKDIIKTAKKNTEEHKIILRNERRDALELIKKSFEEKKITEDIKFKLQDELQKLTESYIKIIDEILVRKEKEIMEV